MTTNDRNADTIMSMTLPTTQESREDVIGRIEFLVASVVQQLDEGKVPVLTSLPSYPDMEYDEDRPPMVTKTFAGHQGRSVTNILLVLSFCHELLLAQRTTTTREVYYHYVTHFRSPTECNAAILDAGVLLGVPRHALGLHASPKGWCSGDLQLMRHNQCVWDGCAATAALPITSEWLYDAPEVRTTQARCIVVIEKEGVFHRLVQDGLVQRYPCILVTGKGFPDLATRALVHTLHRQLRLPVRGVCDCNPYGVLVLQTYQCSGRKGVDGGDCYGVPIDWMGLRPSQLEHLKAQVRQDTAASLPSQVFQSLTALDRKRLSALLDPQHAWITSAGSDELAQRRWHELIIMMEAGYKVELEALNWLGMDFCATWIEHILLHQDRRNAIPEPDVDLPWLDII
jgi:meiotic recombination protein SPO11